MRAFFLLLTLFTSFQLFAQIESVGKLDVISLQERTVLLKSGSNILSNETRSVIPIDLPPNTVSWMYRFSVHRSQNSIKNLKKGHNLVSALATLNPTTSSLIPIIENIPTPVGEDICDIYALSEKNIHLFKNKNNLSFDSYYYYEDYNCINCKEGKRFMPSNITEISLGLKNPNKFVKIYVYVEIVAFVGWTHEQEEEIVEKLSSEFKTNLNPEYQLNDYDYSSLASCITGQIITEYTPNSFRKLSNYQQEKIYKERVVNCWQELNLESKKVTYSTPSPTYNENEELSSKSVTTQNTLLEFASNKDKTKNELIDNILKQWALIDTEIILNKKERIELANCIAQKTNYALNELDDNSLISMIKLHHKICWKELSYEENSFISLIRENKPKEKIEENNNVITLKPKKTTAEKLIGAWKDENSNFWIYDNGTIFIQFHSLYVSSIDGKWYLEGEDNLIIEDGTIKTNYKIITLNKNEFIYYYPNNDVTFSAKKIKE